MTRLALLPAAVLAPVELQAEFGAVPSGMVPLDSRPVLSHVAYGYRTRGFDVAVAVHERADVIDSYLTRNPELKLRTLGIGASRSIGETVLRALRRCEGVDQLVINFADTILRDEIPDGDVVVYAEQPDTYRWTTFRTDDRGGLYDLVDKQQDKGDVEGLRVFAGVFGIADAARFVEELETAVAEPANEPRLDPFYTALRRYLNDRPGQVTFHAATDWYDVGHLDTYYTTRRTFFLNSRYFNSVDVDISRGVIRKSSTSEDKFRDEVRWYLDLPDALRHVAPRIFGYDLWGSPPWVEMEFYGYPTLNDAHLVGHWDAGLWRQVLGAVGGLLDQLADHVDPAVDAPAAVQAQQQMYETKTLLRLAPVLADPGFAPFMAEEVVINGGRCLGLQQAVNRLPELLRTTGALDPRPATVLHGDLCLSNILFDRRNTIVRVVDPRGSFGAPGIYGDQFYDLAKLAHSFEGDYDLLVNGLFDLSWEGGTLRLDPHLESRHHRTKSLFASWLAERVGERLPAVRLVESLLFLSMIPLHADRPRSQQAFLARGLQLFTSVLDGTGTAW